eukprot:365958-Chlamydomonas_euryale.AAC.7
MRGKGRGRERSQEGWGPWENAKLSVVWQWWCEGNGTCEEEKKKSRGNVREPRCSSQHTQANGEAADREGGHQQQRTAAAGNRQRDTMCQSVIQQRP